MPIRSAVLGRAAPAVGALAVLVGCAGILAAIMADEPRPDTVSTAEGAPSTSLPSTTSAAPPEQAPGSTVPPALDPEVQTPPDAAPQASPATTTATSPASPEADRRIYCIAFEGLVSVGPDGSDRRVVAPGEFREPHLAPDGSWLIATLGGTDLHRIASDGSGISLIAEGLWLGAKISPDGQRIAAVRVRPEEGFRLAILDPSGTVLTEFPVYEPQISSTLDWMRDGRRIVFSDGYVVNVYDLETRTTEQFSVPPVGTVAYPAVSPNGRLLALSNGEDVLVTSPDGGPLWEVTGEAYYHAKQPVWEDDETLLFTYDGDSLARVRADGTGFEVLARFC